MSRTSTADLMAKLSLSEPRTGKLSSTSKTADVMDTVDLLKPMGNTGAPWNIPSQSGVGECPKKALRIYSLWLAGALKQPGAPSMPESYDRGRVAMFWIATDLMKHLSLPVKTIDLEDTRMSLLIRLDIANRSLHLTTTPETLLKHVGEIQEAVPGSEADDIVPLLMDTISLHSDTPELTLEAFGRILDGTPIHDLRHFARMVSMGHRAFRLSSRRVDDRICFLANTPPVPRISLQERAMSGAAYLSNTSLNDRFAHIFTYHRTLWDTQDQ
jgi:hypothetical protein